MIFILALVCIQVFGVLLNEVESLAIFLIFLMLFAYIVIGLQPHKFRTIYVMEITSLGLNILATYILLFGLFGTGASY